MAPANTESSSLESALIMVDIEGATGVWQKEQCKPGTSAWKEARNHITADLNAAVTGLKKIGVLKIHIKDMHGNGFNLLPEKMDRDICLLQGHFWKPLPLLGKMPPADVAIFIGWHGAPDQPEAFSPHIFHRDIRSLELNHKRVTEVELMSAVLGEFKIPVAFVTADKPALERIKGNMPWVSTCEIPKCNPPDHEINKTRQLIEKKVKLIKNKDSRNLLELGSHKVTLETRSRTLSWQSPSASATYENLLLRSVFKPCPALLIPPLLYIYRNSCRMLYGTG